LNNEDHKAEITPLKFVGTRIPLLLANKLNLRAEICTKNIAPVLFLTKLFFAGVTAICPVEQEEEEARNINLYRSLPFSFPEQNFIFFGQEPSCNS
jgi:hypothetical protein